MVLATPKHFDCPALSIWLNWFKLFAMISELSAQKTTCLTLHVINIRGPYFLPLLRHTPSIADTLTKYNSSDILRVNKNGLKINFPSTRRKNAVLVWLVLFFVRGRGHCFRFCFSALFRSWPRKFGCSWTWNVCFEFVAVLSGGCLSHRWNIYTKLWNLNCFLLFLLLRVLPF